MSKQTIFSSADPFSQAPLLTLLPLAGDIAKLESYTSALYARFEQVEGLRNSEAAKSDSNFEKQCAQESAMLRHVLDWLAVKPGAV